MSGSSLLVTSTHPRPSVPVWMSLIDRALPFSTMKSLVTPANRTIDSSRYDGRPGLGVDDDRGFGKSAGPQQTALVGDHGFHLKRSARRLYRRVDPGDLALDGHAGMGPGREPDALSELHVLGILLGDLAPEADRVFDHELGDRLSFLDHLPSDTCRLVMPYERTLVRLRLGGMSLGVGARIVISFNVWPAWLRLTLDAIALAMTVRADLDRVVEIGGGCLPVGFGVLELLGRARSALGERTLPRQVLLGFLACDLFLDDGGHLGDGVVGNLADQELLADSVFLDELFGLSLGDSQLDQLTQVSRFGLLHAQLGIDRVELDQGLTGLDPVADVVMDLDDPAGSLGPNGHLLPAPQACR